MFNLIFITHMFIYLRIFIRKHFVFIIHIIIVPNLTHWNKSQGLKLFITQKERKLNKVQVRLAHGSLTRPCCRAVWEGSTHGLRQAVSALRSLPLPSVPHTPRTHALGQAVPVPQHPKLQVSLPFCILSPFYKFVKLDS